MSELTCRQFDELVHDFVRMELLDVGVREALLEHAAHCELCAQRMADAAALAEATDRMGRSALSKQTPFRVEAALLAAFRNQHRRASWRRSLEWAGVGAAAAVLLVFLWISSGRSKGQTSTPAPKKEVTSQTGAPLQAAAPAAPQQNRALPAPDLAVSAAPLQEAYVAADFVPVPYTGAISPDDPGMIVRVQLTRTSLAQLGYPVAITPDEDLILADVLVGEDGWPRGVKVIQ